MAVAAWVWSSSDVTPAASARGAVVLVSAVAVVGLVNLAAFSTLMLLLGHDLRALRPVIGIGWCAGLAVNVLLGLLFAIAYEGAAAGLFLVPVLFVVLHFTYEGYAAARADRARLLGMHRAVSGLTEPLTQRQALQAFLRTTA